MNVLKPWLTTLSFILIFILIVAPADAQYQQQQRKKKQFESNVVEPDPYYYSTPTKAQPAAPYGTQPAYGSQYGGSQYQAAQRFGDYRKNVTAPIYLYQMGQVSGVDIKAFHIEYSQAFANKYFTYIGGDFSIKMASGGGLSKNFMSYYVTGTYNATPRTPRDSIFVKLGLGMGNSCSTVSLKDCKDESGFSFKVLAGKRFQILHKQLTFDPEIGFYSYPGKTDFKLVPLNVSWWFM